MIETLLLIQQIREEYKANGTLPKLSLNEIEQLLLFFIELQDENNEE